MKKIISSILTAVMMFTSTTAYAVDNSAAQGYSNTELDETFYFIINTAITWVNKSIQITATAYHDDYEILTITDPDGVTYDGDNFKYVIHENGNYSMGATSTDGTSRSVVYEMTWIDKVNPTIESVVVEDGELVVYADDNLSGIATYSFDGGKTFQEENKTTFDDTLIYELVVKDNAQNTSQEYIYCEQNHRITIEDSMDIMLSSTLDFKDIDEVYNKLELTDIATIDLRLTSNELDKEQEVFNLLAVEELVGYDDILGGFTLDLNQIVGGEVSQTYNDLDRTITLWMDFPTWREHYVVIAEDGKAEFLSCWYDNGLKAFQTDSLQSFYIVAGYDSSIQELIILDHENQTVETLEVTRGQVITVVDYQGNITATITIGKNDDVIVLSEPTIPSDAVFTGWAVGVNDDGDVIVSPGYSFETQEIDIYDHNNNLVNTITVKVGQELAITNEDGVILDRDYVVENHGDLYLPNPTDKKGQELDYWTITQTADYYNDFTPTLKYVDQEIVVKDADGNDIETTNLKAEQKVIVTDKSGNLVYEVEITLDQEDITIPNGLFAEEVESFVTSYDADGNMLIEPIFKEVEEPAEELEEINVYDYEENLVDTIYAKVGQKVLVTDEEQIIIDRFDIIENHGEINLPEPYLERGEALDYWLIEQDSPIYIHFTPIYKSSFETVEITDADGETIVTTDMVVGEKVIVKNTDGEVLQEVTLTDGQNSIQLNELAVEENCVIDYWELLIDDDFNVVLTPILKLQETQEETEQKEESTTNKPIIVVKPSATTTEVTIEDLLNIELEVNTDSLTELEFDMDKLSELLEKDGQSIEFLSQKVIPYTVVGGKEIIAKISSFENGKIKFIPPTAGVYNLKINDKYFVDTIGNEYEESIAYTTSREILVGTSFEIFNTEREITRAEFYEVLYRKLANSKKFELQEFEDVNENAYYFNSSAWAKENNLVEVSEKFLPNEVITLSEIGEVLNKLFDLNLSYESDEVFNRDEWTLFIYEINKLLLN